MTPSPDQQAPTPLTDKFSPLRPSHAPSADVSQLFNDPLATLSDHWNSSTADTDLSSTSHHGNIAPPSSMKGKPAVVPAMSAAICSIYTISQSNHSHSTESSLTMAANGPNSFAANGVAGTAIKSSIQFGFDSPALTQSDPHISGSTPDIIHGEEDLVIASPAHSPSPIPQPSASGGRPPLGLLQSSNHMTFGSLSSENERQLRQGSLPPNARGSGPGSGMHFRRESTHSSQSDVQSRGSFASSSARGRTSLATHAHTFNSIQVGYPPHGQYRNSSGQSRGMPLAFQSQTRSLPYTNPPQASRSPAPVPPSLPTTPNMVAASMQTGVAIHGGPQYHYPPPVASSNQQPQQVDQFGRPVPVSYGYNMTYMAHAGNSPNYGQFYGPTPYQPAGHAMSRSPSQPDRVSNVNHLNQSLMVSSSLEAQNAHSVSSAKNFIKPGRKNAAVQIKNAAGEIVDTSTFKHPVCPSPASQQYKIPSAASSPAASPAKSLTPTFRASDNQVTLKTAKQIKDELKEKIKQATRPATESEQKTFQNQYKSGTDATHKMKSLDTCKPALDQKQSEILTTNIADEDELGEKPMSSTQSDIVPYQNPTIHGQLALPKDADTANSMHDLRTSNVMGAVLDEEDMDKIIREIEELDARRELEEVKHRKRKDSITAKMTETQETQVLGTDEELRAQEREMERLEQQRVVQREADQASGNTLSLREALACSYTEKIPIDSGTKNTSDMSTQIEKKRGPGTVGMDDEASRNRTVNEKRAKPAALNLMSLNAKPVEAPQPSAALQSLKSAKFLQTIESTIYPPGIDSPNVALNAAVTRKGKSFKYDSSFLLQFQRVFTEQPSVEFHHQVKSIIGESEASRSGARSQGSGSLRQHSRGIGTTSMGSFNALAGRTLPPGTTSTERIAMANGSLPRPSVPAIGTFQVRPGTQFPTSSSMSRTSSQSNTRHLPNSPRQTSRSTRGSRRTDLSAKDAQAAKTMPLTAGQDIKPIQITASGWKSTSVAKGVTSSALTLGYLDPEMVQRKVKAALNKMTPEKFDRIAEQILEIASQSKDESDGRTLRQVIQLTFEKATDEAHWASMYAKFCKRMLETMSPEVRDDRIKDKHGNVVGGGNLFRKYLLNRCQEDFERGWSTGLPEIKDADHDGDKKPGEAALMSDEYYVAAAAKRRGLGLVQFIGELYKLGMLTERIMHECVQKLVDYKGIPDEAEVESLSKLLRTIGSNLDQTEKGRPMMDAYFQRIQSMVDLPELQSRIRFILMDVIDLRKMNWISKEANKGPKTLDEVRAEADLAQATKMFEVARGNQKMSGPRPPVGRGDARNYSAGFAQHTSNQVAVEDLRRLKGNTSRTPSQNVALGPTSMFTSRSNSGRRLGPSSSFGRAGEDSGPSSRTSTPPIRDSTINSNTFSLLANIETDHPTSPPSIVR